MDETQQDMERIWEKRRAEKEKEKENTDMTRTDIVIFEEFVWWYNNVRPHKSLGWKHNDLETPKECFWRKLAMELVGNSLGTIHSY